MDSEQSGFLQIPTPLYFPQDWQIGSSMGSFLFAFIAIEILQGIWGAFKTAVDSP